MGPSLSKPLGFYGHGIQCYKLAYKMLILNIYPTKKLQLFGELRPSDPELSISSSLGGGTRDKVPQLLFISSALLAYLQSWIPSAATIWGLNWARTHQKALQANFWIAKRHSRTWVDEFSLGVPYPGRRVIVYTAGHCTTQRRIYAFKLPVNIRRL